MGIDDVTAGLQDDVGLITTGSQVDKKMSCSCKERSLSSFSCSLSCSSFSFFSISSFTTCAWKVGPDLEDSSLPIPYVKKFKNSVNLSNIFSIY